MKNEFPNSNKGIKSGNPCDIFEKARMIVVDDMILQQGYYEININQIGVDLNVLLSFEIVYPIHPSN